MNQSPSAAELSGRTVNPDASQTQGTKPGCSVRIVDIAALRGDRSIVIGQRKIPAMPTFERAFSAFARGTLIQTPDGQTAVEDLRPGDSVISSAGENTITWIGSATFSASDNGPRMPLTRIMADSFGMSRPESFISLGGAARLLQSTPEQRANADGTVAMTPARAFVDGVNVIEVSPPTPVQLFHIALERHAAILAGGLEVESFHPGINPARDMSLPLKTAYLGLFPHIQSVSEFGPLAFSQVSGDVQHGQSAA